MFARRLPVYLIGGSMELSKRKTGVLLVALFTFSALAAAERPVRPSDPPLVNWRAPATYTPPRPAGARPLAIQSGELTTGPDPFFPVTPCRQFDIRPGTLANNTNLTIALAGAPCGIPSSASAISVNITVFAITGATGNAVFRVGTALNPPTAWINYPPNETQRANAGVVATDGSGHIVVKVNQGGGSIQLTVDVNGYYYNGNTGALLPTGDFFTISGDVAGGPVLAGVNIEGSHVAAYGIEGETFSTGAFSAGVAGVALDGGGQNYGVFGSSFSTTFSAAGVHGEGNGNGQTIGVEGICTSGPPTSLCTGVVGRGLATGGYFTANNSPGNSLYGLAFGTAGIEYGVFGAEASPTLDAAGVFGVDASGSPAPTGSTFFSSSGVRGESTAGVGALGVSSFQGAVGTLVDGAGKLQAAGLLGCSASGCTGGPWGVYAFGNVGASGTKPFIEVHPTDPSKSIRYVALEGPEAGTYFRGTAETHHGMAVIPVPESFRLVTDAEGLTVQLTPIGGPAAMYVVSRDLNQIVVHSDRDGTFDYMVNGVRETFKDWKVMVDGGYMPASPQQKLPGYFSEEQKRRLIANGTYNVDGTVNMTTAERVGWTKIWADREAAAEAAAAKNAAARSAAANQGQQQQ